MNIKKPSTMAKKLLKFFGPHGKRWTKGAFAKDRNGKDVSVKSPKAKKFCMSGALTHLGIIEQQPLRDAILSKAGYQGIASFNDSNRWPTVRRVLKEIAAGA